MERTRIVSIALIILGITTVINARQIVAMPYYLLIVLILLVTSVHLISLYSTRNSKVQQISPIISFVVLLIFLLFTNSNGQLSHAIPTLDSLVNIYENAREGIREIRGNTTPYEYSTNLFLFLMICTWAIAEIAETLGQRLHTCATVLLWYMAITAGIAAQNGSPSIASITLLSAGASWFFLYAFEQGNERAKSHTIAIPKAAQYNNAGRVSIAFLALILLSIFLIMPVAALPSIAPDDIFKFLNNSQDQSELSPLVSMSAQLKRSEQEIMFRAQSNEVQYFRVAVLDDFNGESWSMNSQTKHKPEQIPDTLQTRQLSASIELESLVPKFLPSYYSTQSTSSDEIEFLKHSVLYTQDSSLKQYSLQAIAPPSDLTPEQIEMSSDSSPESVDSSILLPTDFDQNIIDLSKSLASDKGSIYEQVIAIRNFFLDGSFTYDLNVNYSSDQSSMQQFLKEKRGFCEQFATTYAAMIRSIGVPARVIVGFTPGEPDANGVFNVTNLQAHSWVEVYLSNFGWLSVDPTPSGPMPGQSQANIGAVVTTTTTTTLPNDSTSTPQSTSVATTTLPATVTNASSNNGAYVILLLFIVAGITVGLVLFTRRNKSSNDHAYVIATYKELGEKVLEVPPQPDLTIRELEERLSSENVSAREFLVKLSIASYAPGKKISIKELRDAASKARAEKVSSK